jgi:hypothetical protein
MLKSTPGRQTFLFFKVSGDTRWREFYGKTLGDAIKKHLKPIAGSS